MASRLRVNPLRCRKERGNTFVEFALVVVAVTPFIFGLLAMGITLGRSIQAANVTRDVGHMYALSADFSTQPARDIVAKLAEDFDLDPTSGTAVLILSRISIVAPVDCVPIGAACNNRGLPVVTQRLVIGNTSLHASEFATPPAGTVDAKGDVAGLTYMDQPALVAAGFQNVLALSGNDQAWVVEGFFKQPDLNFLTPGFAAANEGTYVRSIF